MGVHGRDVVLKAAFLLHNLTAIFAINGTFIEVPVTQDTDSTPWYNRYWLVELLVPVWMVIFFYAHDMHFFPKKSRNVDSSGRNMHFHSVMVHSRSP